MRQGLWLSLASLHLLLQTDRVQHVGVSGSMLQTPEASALSFSFHCQGPGKQLIT